MEPVKRLSLASLPGNALCKAPPPPPLSHFHFFHCILLALSFFFLLLVVDKPSSEALTRAAATIYLPTALLPIHWGQQHLLCNNCVPPHHLLFPHPDANFSPGTEAHYCTHVGHRGVSAHFIHFPTDNSPPHLQCNTSRFLHLSHFSHSPLKPLFYTEGLVSQQMSPEVSEPPKSLWKASAAKIRLFAPGLEHLSFGNMCYVFRYRAK